MENKSNLINNLKRIAIYDKPVTNYTFLLLQVCLN